MGMDEAQASSFVARMRLPVAEDNGRIIVDFDLIEFPLDQRMTVRQKYPHGEISSDYNDYVIVGIIKRSNEEMIAPAAYGRCSFGKKPEAHHRPPPDHINHRDFVKLISERG